MIALREYALVTVTLLACIALRLLLGKWLDGRARMAMWYLLTLWLAAVLLPGQLSFVGSLWQLLVWPQPLPTQLQPLQELPPLADISVQVVSEPGKWPLIWAAGVLVMLTWLACTQYWQHCTQRRLCGRSQLLDLGLPLPARTTVWVCYAIDSPVTIGLWRSTVFLPESVRDMSPLQQKMVLDHECAHVKCRDALFKAVLAVLAGLLWYCPPVWIMRELVQRDIEHRCDDAVLRCCGADKAQEYIRLLMRFIKLISSPDEMAELSDEMAEMLDEMAEMLDEMAQLSYVAAPSPYERARLLSGKKQLIARIARLNRRRRPRLRTTVLAAATVLCMVLLLGTAPPLRQAVYGEIGATYDLYTQPPEPAPIYVQTHPLLCGWTTTHTVPPGEATVYTDHGSPWQLRANQPVQLKLKMKDKPHGGLIVGYLDVDRQEYVAVYSGMPSVTLQLDWSVPLTSNYCFWVLAPGGDYLDIEYATIRMN